MEEKKYFENKELEPKHNVVTAFFLRHGETEYLENKTSAEDKLLMKDDYPNDLTAEGETNVRISAERIAQKINPEKDIVIFWSSPAWRAQGSEKIIREEFEKCGISILKDSSISLMKDLEHYDKAFMVNLWEDIIQEGKSPDLVYAHDPKFQEKNDKFETQPEVKKRAEAVFNYIRYLAEHLDLKGKRLCIVGVSHFEFLNPVIEDIFETKIEKGEQIKRGEEVVFDFDYNTNTKDMTISADFRNGNKKEITFDKEKRYFKLD